MKRNYFLAFFTLLLLAGTVHAQSKTTIKINPLSLGVLTFNVQGEHAFGERISGQLGLYYGGFKFGAGVSGLASAKIAYNWFGITPEFRYFIYTPDQAPNGFYVGPFLRFQNVRASYEVEYSYTDNNGALVTDVGSIKQKLPAIGGGAVIGYSWVIGKHFVWDNYLGPSYYGGKWSIETDIPDNADYTLPTLRSGFSGFAFRFGTSIGVAF